VQALPAVTQDAGFVPSAATLTVVCLFSAATGQHMFERHVTAKLGYPWQQQLVDGTRLYAA
jgi:hypothetical protein